MRIVLNIPDELIREINEFPEIDEFVQAMRVSYRDPNNLNKTKSVDLKPLLIQLHTLVREAIGGPISQNPQIQDLTIRYGGSAGARTMFGVPLCDLTREELIAVINYQHKNVI